MSITTHTHIIPASQISDGDTIRLATTDGPLVWRTVDRVAVAGTGTTGVEPGTVIFMLRHDVDGRYVFLASPDRPVTVLVDWLALDDDEVQP